MTQLLLPENLNSTPWQKFKMTASAWVQPMAYSAMKNAETQIRNTDLIIASNHLLEEKRQDFRIKELQLQYMQFKEREANLAEQAQLNREFQSQQAEITRKFQENMAALSHERQKELTAFRAKVDLAIQEKNLEFQRWSLEQQRELQFALKSLDAELARELRAYDRETALQVIEEKKKSDNSPIWLVASQILGSNSVQEPIPLRIFFSPPVLPYDRMGKSPDSSRGFPEMADFLAEELRQFFGKYNAQARNTDFIYGAWVSNFFHGEAAALSLFDALKTEPTLILESSVEGDAFNLRAGYWGLNSAKYRYQSFISGLSWQEALNDFAKARAFKWYKRKQEWIAEGKPAELFDKRYGAETVRRFMSNLEILEREQQCIEDGDDPNEIERPYSWHKQDYNDLKQFMAVNHCLAAGLMADEYFLVDISAQDRFRPLFPELLPDLLKSVPETELGGLVDLVVSYYQNLYAYLGQEESCWIPELVLDLAKSLMKLPDLSWAKAQVLFSVQHWLKLHHLPSSEDLHEVLDTMESSVSIADREYVEKLNQSLADLGESRSIDLADACFNRAIRQCRQEDYEPAISDFDQAIELKPEWSQAFYNRGLVYACLNNYEKAIEDYTESLGLSPDQANTYNNRANAYYKLGKYQAAIDDYDQALKICPDLPEAEKNRAIARGVLDEIRRKKAEEEQRRKEEERRKKAEEEQRRKEEERRKKAEEEQRRKEEERRKKAEEEQRRKEEERRKKAEEERKGKLFEFETVKVNNKGKITQRIPKTGRQKLENLGKGLILEMVYIPGGTFTMGSPRNEADRGNETQHQVTLSPFFMGKYPVIQEQWEAVMGNNPSSFKGKNRPVERVSWEDAVEFCETFSRKTGKSYRLPTEAEWEYACRAGTSTPFYFGQTITPDLVNYDGNYPYGSAPEGEYREETTDAGSFPPNAFGLYDMHGNVWEWCQDWYGDYASGAVTDPMGASSGSDRVLRGGSWYRSGRHCRSASRRRYSPDSRCYIYGLRLASSPG